MTRDAFGPNLRRARIQRGLSLGQIATAMKVEPALLEELEQNEFSRWPKGVYARSFLRQYADAVGVDSDLTVDEFCRWFPQGDRRAERLVREHAEIVGHDIEWQEDRSAETERRDGLRSLEPRSRSASSAIGTLFVRLRRALLKA